MKAALKGIVFTENGIKITVEFSASTGESFTTFNKETYFDSVSATDIKIKAWVDSLLAELKAQLNQTISVKTAVGYTKELK